MRYGAIRLWVTAATAVFLLCTATAHAERPPWKRRGRRRTCYIKSEPEQAAVYIEKKKHGIACYTPCKIRLPYRKTFKIFLKKPGFQEHKDSITVGRRRRNRRFRFVLKREIKPGILDVRSDSGGTATGGHIYVDGVALGTIPSQVKVKPGRHQVEIKRKGYKPFKQWVNLSQGQTFTLVVKLESKSKPKGSILITSDPVGAEVYVDGKRIDTTPTVARNLVPGAHTVEVRAKGAPVWKQVVEVKPNTQVKVVAKVAKKPRPRATKVGAIRVLSNVAKADVYVDGEFKGQAPVTVSKLIPGDHLVEVKAKGYLPKEMRVTVKKQQQSLVKLDLEPKPKERAVGTLRVQSAVPGAIVFLDGAALGKAPIEKKDVSAGEHIVIVRKPGHKDHRVKVKVAKGGTHVITAELKAVGVIKVVTKQPGAEVLIDSVKVGTTPLQSYELEAGEYTLEVRRPKGKYKPHRVTFRIKGGERRNFSVALKKQRKGPSPKQMAAIKQGLSSYGARTVPPRSFIADVSMGYPYIVNAKLTVGTWKRGYFGIDAGFSFRSLFMYMNEFAINARGQFFERGPFSVGAFTELGAGIGLGRRNSFFWNFGPIISLSFKNLVTASLILWFNVYSDRICRTSPADKTAGETEPNLCNITEGWPDDPLDTGGRDTTANDGSRKTPYQVVTDPDAPNGIRKVYMNPKPFHKHNLRKRFNGWKFYITFVVETALTPWLSVFGKIDFVPAQEAQQRALYMEYFTASSYKYHDAVGDEDPKVTTKGVMPEVDWGIYGQLGVSFKF
jgi:hypothetical protein